MKRWLSANQATINNETFAFLLDITQQLHENEIPLVVGSDSGVLLSPTDSLRIMKCVQEKAGMTPMDVLRSATMIAAKALKENN